MKTNYKSIKKSLERLNDARMEFNKASNLRMGVISGGPDIEEERAEFDSALLELEGLVRRAIRNNCRLSYLLEILDGEITLTALVKSKINEQRNEREWKRVCDAGLIK